VVIVIMVILLSLAVVNMAGQQKYARDNERKNDAENIARGLEQYYTANTQYPNLGTAATIVSTGSLPDVEDKSYRYSFNNNTVSFTPASGFTAAVTDASGASLATANTIVYLPMIYSTANSRWEQCDASELCTRYTLTYVTETAGTVTVKSRMQQ
jgi:type II secretory pathway pseudopilin PulG